MDGNAIITNDTIHDPRDDGTGLRKRAGLLEQSNFALSTKCSSPNAASAAGHIPVFDTQLTLLRAVRRAPLNPSVLR